MRRCFLYIAFMLCPALVRAYSHADTLRGSNGSGRNWWKVIRYDLRVNFDSSLQSITGSNTIKLRITSHAGDSMQIDLQEPMVLDSLVSGTTRIPTVREGNVYWASRPFSELPAGAVVSVTAFYHGTPRKAINAPWDGGFVRTRDANGKPWAAVACQGLGASVWWPCKDAQWEEPDSGMTMTYGVPEPAVCVGNGRLLDKKDSSGICRWTWQVKNPINNYDVSFYIGDYVHWHDTLHGEKGALDLDFWVLRANEKKAREQFAPVKQMLHCFEYWLGPYPFYEDGYKLVEAPYLGMEHQSATAYGNKYKMGYLGSDRTGTGIGMNFDYIIVHESGHEWFGNNITAGDIADNWVQEGITTYSESLITESILGTAKGKEYCRGEWNNIFNNRPVIGDYGVNEEGAPDMYDKGAAILYMIREQMQDENRFRKILRGMTEKFYHGIVTTADIEHYFTQQSGIDLAPFFEQYLRTSTTPQVEYYIKDGQFYFRFSNAVPGLSLPLHISSGEREYDIRVTGEWQHMKWKGGYNVRFAKDYLFTVKS